MPPPEILRRCAVCGAASRPGTLFCPQCGNPTGGMRPGSGVVDTVDLHEAPDQPVLDPRLQTTKLDSSPSLQTRKLASAEGQEPGREETAETQPLRSGSAGSRKRLKKKLKILKSALQSTVDQKAALLAQGRQDEAGQLDSQIERQKLALAAAVEKVMAPTERLSDLDAGTSAIASPGPYTAVAGDDEQRELNSQINVDNPPSAPYAAVAGDDEQRELNSQISVDNPASAPYAAVAGDNEQRELNSQSSVDNPASAPYAAVAGDDARRELNSQINVDNAAFAPTAALKDDIHSRGEKLRQTSSVVLEGAVYDPSLRFVLVAAILFVVFLVIMLLSKIIT